MTVTSKLDAIETKTDAILAMQRQMYEAIERLEKVVFVGNGQKALTTRTEALEGQFSAFMKQCEVCKKVILDTGDDGETEAGEEVEKAKVVEQWKFRTAVVAAFLAAIGPGVVELIKNIAVKHP